MELDDIIRELLLESHENLDQLDLDLVALESEPGSRPLLASAFRTIHTIKGTCGFLPFPRLERLAHVGESLLAQLRDGRLALTPQGVEALLRLVDTMRSVLARIETAGDEGPADHADLLRTLTALQQSQDGPAEAPDREPYVSATLTGPVVVGAQPLGEVLVRTGGAEPDDVTLAVLAQGGGDDRRLGEIPAAGLRRSSSRQAVACVCLLAMIVAGTAAVAWWSWETLQDRRLELGAQAQPLHDQSDRRLLTTDLVERADVGTGTRTPESRPLSADLERSARSVRAVAPADITVDGRVVAGVVITVALGAATAASSWVLRRYRRRTPLAPPVTGKGWSDGQEAVDAEVDVQEVAEAGAAGDVESLGTDPGAPLERAEADATGEVVAEQAVHDGLVVQPTSPPAAVVAQRQPDDDEDLPGPVPRVLPPDSGAWPVDAGGAAPPPQPSTFGITSDGAARQRLYDRRMSRSVPYVHPAWLWWAKENAPATVQELDLTGLRCLLAVPLDAGAAHGPALGGQARMSFPLNGSTMKVDARVQWKEHTAVGMELRLDFVGLTHDDSAALERLLLSMA